MTSILTLRGAVSIARERFARPEARRMLALTQYVLLATIIVYLFARLSEVGWRAVAGSFPSSPLFYIIFLVRYFALPLSEISTYKIVWRRPLWRHFPAFIRKRVYNFAVMGYSGEAFFSLWARRNLDLSDKEILVGVKDNNLISALASNLATAILVFSLFITGRLVDDFGPLRGASILFGLAFVSSLGLALAFMVFKRRIIGLPDGVMMKVFAINAARILLMIVLHALLYWSAIPGPELTDWLIFVALHFVLSRAPLVPNPDIVFLTAALHLASSVNISETVIAGMLVAEAGLSQILNFTLFAATMHLARWRSRTKALEAPTG